MPQTQAKEIQALIKNDLSGLRLIYSEYLPRIQMLITKNGGSADDANDIFQDALVIIYEKAKGKDFKLTSSFYTLLYGVCRNLWGNRIQKKSFQEVALPEDIKYINEENILNDILKEERAQIFLESFNQLGGDCKKLLRLFFDKIKMEKIKEMMGFSSVSYAKKRKFVCKEKLVKIVKSDSRFKEIEN